MRRLKGLGSGVASVGLILAPLAACGGGGGGGGSGPGELLGASQNRSVDGQGRTVDFSFDRRLAPLPPDARSFFAASGGQAALSANLLLPEEQVVRVVYDALVLPGEATFDVAGLRARSGRAILAAVDVPLSSTDAAPPSASASASAVSNAANDRLSIAFDDAIVPADLVDPSKYSFEHPVGTPISLGGGPLSVDPMTGAVEIVFDGAAADGANLQFGLPFRLVVSGVRDLGGNSIGAAYEIAGFVGGDGVGPSVLAATQNALVDPSGATVDFAFDEQLDAASATSGANFAGSGGQAPLGVLLLPGEDLVRVLFDLPIFPGADTILVQNVRDLAGNAMVAVAALAVGTTDLVPPSLSDASVETVSGYANDLLRVVFSEAMLPADASDLAAYALESPAGSPVSLAGGSMAYDEPSRTATITLAANLQTGAGFLLACAGVRDLAGNPLPLGASFAGVVGGDAVAPGIVSATQNLAIDPFGRVVDLLFDEPVELASSPSASFVASEGQAFVSALELPGAMVVRLAYADVVVPGSTLLAIQGVEDPAGNAGGAVLAPVAPSDFVAPYVAGSSASAFENGANDQVVVSFSEQVVPSDAESAAAYAFESPIGSAFSLAGAAVAYDAMTLSATITLPAGTNLQTGASYLVSAAAVRDVGGNPMGSPASSTGVVAGDAAPPTVLVADRNELVDPSSRTVDVTFSEEVDPATAQDVANYEIYGSGRPDILTATLLPGGITVRLTTDRIVKPGPHRMRVRDVEDLAGNAMPLSGGSQITP